MAKRIRVDNNNGEGGEVESGGDILSLKDLFPKNLRSRAETILRLIGSHVKVSENNSVIYSDNTIGSNIIDLIKYVIIPSGSVMRRPLRAYDATLFEKVLKQAGTPDSILAKNTTATWKTLYK